MQVAKARLKINQRSDIPIYGVTPAEVMVLRAGHEASAGGNPITDVEIVGDSALTDDAEIARLRVKYNQLRVKNEEGRDINVVQRLFPGVGNRVPQTFKELNIEAPKAKVLGPETYNPEPEGGSTEGGSDADWWEKNNPKAEPAPEPQPEPKAPTKPDPKPEAKAEPQLVKK